MINIFLKKSYTKCGGEANPTLFYEKSKVKKSNFGFIFSEQAEKKGFRYPRNCFNIYLVNVLREPKLFWSLPHRSPVTKTSEMELSDPSNQSR